MTAGRHALLLTAPAQAGAASPTAETADPVAALPSPSGDFALGRAASSQRRDPAGRASRTTQAVRAGAAARGGLPAPGSSANSRAGLAVHALRSTQTKTRAIPARAINARRPRIGSGTGVKARVTAAGKLEKLVSTGDGGVSRTDESPSTRAKTSHASHGCHAAPAAEMFGATS